MDFMHANGLMRQTPANARRIRQDSHKHYLPEDATHDHLPGIGKNHTQIRQLPRWLGRDLLCRDGSAHQGTVLVLIPTLAPR